MGRVDPVINPLELEKRAREGSYVDSRSFDLGLSKAVARLERDYDIRYEAGSIIPCDPTLAKDLFNAGLELLLEVGAYVVDVNRVVKLNEDEIREALSSVTTEVHVGEGSESKDLRARKPATTEKPFVFGGYAGTPTPLEDFKESALTYALEPLVCALDHGSITCIEGLNVSRGAPSEVEATLIEIDLLRAALREAGRDGMHILACESSSSSAGNLAAMATGRLRKGDAQLVPVLNELKISNDLLLKAHVALQCGVHNAALVDPIVGGFARGAAGSAICSVAEALLTICMYKASYVLIHPYHIHLKATSARECLWVEAAIGLAGENLRIPLVGDVWPANGGGTLEMLYEVAANAMVASSCGLNLLGPAPANGEKPHGSGLEARLMAEIGIAATGMKPEEASEVAAEIVKLYEASLRDPNPGLPFRELYDPNRRSPSQWWQEMYEKVKRVLNDYGFRIPA